MTPAEIAEARRLAAAATLPPWNPRYLQFGSQQGFVEHPAEEGQAYGVEILGDDDYPTKDGDIQFIAAARTGWPAAIDEVERLTAALAAEKERADRLAGVARAGHELFNALAVAGAYDDDGSRQERRQERLRNARLGLDTALAALRPGDSGGTT